MPRIALPVANRSRRCRRGRSTAPRAGSRRRSCTRLADRRAARGSVALGRVRRALRAALAAAPASNRTRRAPRRRSSWRRRSGGALCRLRSSSEQRRRSHRGGGGSAGGQRRWRVACARERHALRADGRSRRRRALDRRASSGALLQAWVHCEPGARGRPSPPPRHPLAAAAVAPHAPVEALAARPSFRSLCRSRTGWRRGRRARAAGAAARAPPGCALGAASGSRCRRSRRATPTRWRGRRRSSC